MHPLETTLKYLPANQRKQLEKSLSIRPVGRPRKLTESQCQELIQDYRTGSTLGQLGRKYNVSDATARQVLIRADEPRRRGGGWKIPDHSTTYEVISMSGKGHTQSEIARLVGVSRQRVHSILKRWF